MLFSVAMKISRNANLQELWDWRTHPTVRLMKGTVEFIENARLCLSAINDSMRAIHIVSGQQPVIPDTNGYSAVCT